MKAPRLPRSRRSKLAAFAGALVIMAGGLVATADSASAACKTWPTKTSGVDITYAYWVTTTFQVPANGCSDINVWIPEGQYPHNRQDPKSMYIQARVMKSKKLNDRTDKVYPAWVLTNGKHYVLKKGIKDGTYLRFEFSSISYQYADQEKIVVML